LVKVLSHRIGYLKIYPPPPYPIFAGDFFMTPFFVEQILGQFVGQILGRISGRIENKLGAKLKLSFEINNGRFLNK